MVYDIGAGSGSVSVELSLHAPRGRVLAFESEQAALNVLRENRRRFLCGNLRIVPGMAPDTLPDRDSPDGRPDLVFVGGSRGRLSSILNAVLERSPDCVIAVHAVTMETEQAILQLAPQLSESHSLQLQTLSVSALRQLGSYHLRSAQNPITLALFIPKEC